MLHIRKIYSRVCFNEGVSYLLTEYLREVSSRAIFVDHRMGQYSLQSICLIISLTTPAFLSYGFSSTHLTIVLRLPHRQFELNSYRQLIPYQYSVITQTDAEKQDHQSHRLSPQLHPQECGNHRYGVVDRFLPNLQ